MNITTNDSKEKKSSTIFDVVVVLDNLRSSHNVGNIYRLCESLNIKAIFPCGYTAYPPHPKIIKTARGTENDTPTHHYDKTIDACQELKNQGYNLVAIETTKEATDLWDIVFEPKTALIFGNEALGVNEDVLNLCDTVVELSLFGRKNSINVSNCAAVVLFKTIKDLN